MPPLVVAAGLLWYAIGYRLLALRPGVLSRARRDGEALAEARVPHLRARLDVAFTPFEDEVAKFAVPLQAIVVVAPLAGLLGTVAGMIETFDSLGDMALYTGGGGGIAAGISQALLTTQMGLAVAIPGLLVGRLLKRRQRRLEDGLEQLKDELVGRAALGAGEAVAA
ncbi:MAG: MotA/TolQ/ExbB proton channel family protein [Deltaproteobacteria bacterium]|nr:MotA/TolQ/ExbB proton channel family protein [Deltaproteobacteria bacterium]